MESSSTKPKMKESEYGKCLPDDRTRLETIVEASRTETREAAGDDLCQEIAFLTGGRSYGEQPDTASSSVSGPSRIEEVDEIPKEKKRERPPPNEDSEDLDRIKAVAKKPKFDGLPSVSESIQEDDPFYRAVNGGSIEQMVKAIPCVYDTKYGDQGFRLYNATGLASKSNLAMKLAILLQQPKLIKLDFHGMIQLACQNGSYQALAVILGDDRLYEDPYMTKFCWDGLFTGLFDEVRSKGIHQCRGQLICLAMLADNPQCQLILKSNMKALRMSMTKPRYDSRGNEIRDTYIGNELPLYKFLAPWL
jgi:hypothetical protein